MNKAVYYSFILWQWSVIAAIVSIAVKQFGTAAGVLTLCVLLLIGRLMDAHARKQLEAE